VARPGAAAQIGVAQAEVSENVASLVVAIAGRTPGLCHAERDRAPVEQVAAATSEGNDP